MSHLNPWTPIAYLRDDSCMQPSFDNKSCLFPWPFSGGPVESAATVRSWTSPKLATKPTTDLIDHANTEEAGIYRYSDSSLALSP